MTDTIRKLIAARNELAAADKLHYAALVDDVISDMQTGFAALPCTCRSSSMALDIDRCPRHGT